MRAPLYASLISSAAGLVTHCDGTGESSAQTNAGGIGYISWGAGGTRASTGQPTGGSVARTEQCGSAGAGGDYLPMSTLDGVIADAANDVIVKGSDHWDECCVASCGISNYKAGAGPSPAPPATTATTKGDVYCGEDKLPVANQATTAATTTKAGTVAYPGTAERATCCQDACIKTGSSPVTYKAGEGADSSPNYFCGLDKVPVANGANVLSGAATNSGNRKSTCCQDACGKVSFLAGVGADDSSATKPKYYCGLNRGPVANQNSVPSGSNSVGATEKNTCCDDYCGKVTFSAGAGKDDTTSGSETYFCGENRVPVADQETTLAGTDSIGAGEKNTCCDDACGKVNFKAGKGKDDTKEKNFFCGENKVPKKKQGDIPSGSDSIGSGQKGTCCAAACSTAKYTAGKGVDKDTKYYCGEGRMPLADQKTLPCDGSKCTSSGKSHCCTATCSADKNKWASGAKPKSPAKNTMYCGKGFVPKKGLEAVACAADPCDEATDAANCCEKPKANNTTGTTTGAASTSLAVFTAVVGLSTVIMI